MDSITHSSINPSQILDRNDLEPPVECYVNSPEAVQEAIDVLEIDYLHLQKFHASGCQLLRILNKEENILRGILETQSDVNLPVDEELRNRMGAFDDPTLPWPPTAPRVVEKMSTYLSLAAEEVEAAVERELTNLATKLRKYEAAPSRSSAEPDRLKSDGNCEFSSATVLDSRQTESSESWKTCCEEEIAKIGLPCYMPVYEEPLDESVGLNDEPTNLVSQEVRGLVNRRCWADAVYQLFNDYLANYDKMPIKGTAE